MTDEMLEFIEMTVLPRLDAARETINYLDDYNSQRGMFDIVVGAKIGKLDMLLENVIDNLQWAMGYYDGDEEE